MNMRHLITVLVCVACVLLVQGPNVHAQGNEGTKAADVLVLGRVSDDPAAHYDQLKPLLDFLVPRLQSVGIRSGRILMAKDLQQMTSYLRRGRVDLLNETAGNAAVLEYRGVAHSILNTERNGVTHYHGLFFVRKDSAIQSLADLRGHRLAFQSPYSTSAYYLPAAQLLAEGERLELLLSPMDLPAADRIGYVFARTELNISTWVNKGLVDAGVLSNIDWRTPQRMPPAFINDFRIIGRTDDVPRALMMVRAGLGTKLEQRIHEVLQTAAQDPAAAEAFRKFMGTERFVPISPEDRQVLNKLGQGVQRIRAEME